MKRLSCFDKFLSIYTNCLSVLWIIYQFLESIYQFFMKCLSPFMKYVSIYWNCRRYTNFVIIWSVFFIIIIYNRHFILWCSSFLTHFFFSTLLDLEYGKVEGKQVEKGETRRVDEKPRNKDVYNNQEVMYVIFYIICLFYEILIFY